MYIQRTAYHLHKPSGWKSCARIYKTIKFDLVGKRTATKYIQVI